MDLYVIRHAWAAERDGRQWPGDDRRPLTDEGRRRFADMVARLADRGMAPQVIGASPLARCRQTAEILAAGLPGKPEIVTLDALCPDSNLEGLLQWTVRQAGRHERVAWVGHAPDVGRLTSALIGLAEGNIRFAKGAVAAVRFDGPPTAGDGELQWLATAKLLGC